MPERPPVADATVLMFLGQLHSLGYLTDSYPEVLVPGAVHEEVAERGQEPGAPDAVHVENAVEAGDLPVVETDPHPEIEAYDLETGETAVLSLALARDHDEVLADEEAVREVARLHELRPHGTLYFLFTALERGDFGFDGFLDRLERLPDEEFYLDEEVYLEAVREARRITDQRS